MTPANYIAILALLVSVCMAVVNIANAITNNKRAAEKELEEEKDKAKSDQAEQTGIMIALDNIKSMLSDIKAEINTVKQDTRENHDQLIILQQSLKSEHKRLDNHEERLNNIENLLRKGD